LQNLRPVRRRVPYSRTCRARRCAAKVESQNKTVRV
jgi:hypothetical protein